MRISLGAAVLALAAAALLPVQAATAAVPSDTGGRSAARPHVANAPAAGTQVATTHACGTPKPGHMTCFANRRTDVKGIKGLLEANSIPSGYGPADLQNAYNLPADGGAGQTVAIVDAYDDPSAESDLAVYRAQFGLPACTTDNGCFTKVSQRGTTNDLPVADAGWSQEISLDLDMVSAAAPNAHILLVEADAPNTDSLGAAVNTAVELGAKYVSNSYGSSYSATSGSGEDPVDLTTDEEYYNHPGVVLTASSGDSAYGVTYPAASPYVTAVGGTSLTKDGSARGWSESVWGGAGAGGAGSGCSAIEPKPAFQKDTGCANRTVADVSAVADPATGVAVYDSFEVNGWQEFGGTSASAPIIASVYAVAGTPPAGTYPNSFPYENGTGLNDVTSGSNGSCATDYLCTAAEGYDGPTGLGTPNGVSAFRSGPHGKVTGKVTADDTGKPVPGAAVTLGGNRATTDDNGTYSITTVPGDYDLKITEFGYATATRTGVTVTDGATATQDVVLHTLPTHTVSGKVTDGSGHGYPLYARLTVDGMAGTVFTDPYTGAYSVKLPDGADYTLRVTAQAAGYETADPTVTVGDADVSKDVALPVQASECTAAGYALRPDGNTLTFDDSTTPAGWTVTDATGNGGWKFGPATGTISATNPDNYTRGGSGGFAVANSRAAGTAPVDTTLTSPVIDMSEAPVPYVEFADDYTAVNSPASSALVQVTVDGGQNWTTVWHQGTDDPGYDVTQVKVAIPQAAGKTQVQVRFHYTAASGVWWEMDNLFVGNVGCLPTDGGLVQGRVTDSNTGKALTDATVTTATSPAVAAQTTATTEDPALPAGFYSMFVPGTGTQKLTATRPDYSARNQTPTVPKDAVLRQDFALDAGRLTLSTGPVAKTVGWQGRSTAELTLTNTGSASASAEVTERTGTFAPMAKGAEAPLQRVSGTFSPYSAQKTGTMTAGGTVQPHAAAGEPWSSIADYPVAAQDSMVETYQGKVYSVGGLSDTGVLSSLFVYDPSTGAWTAKSSAADGRYAGAHGLIGGKIYVAGGWKAGGGVDSELEIYDPATDRWTSGVPQPTPLAGGASAVLDGKLYMVGGCGDSACGSSRVAVYDPAHSKWSTAPDYPVATAWASCGTVNGVLYCAGGQQSGGSADGYAYDPAQHSWSKIARMPADLWGSAYASANGRLLVSGGITGHSTSRTNAGYAYDPASDSWSAIPNATNAVYRSGSALGVYQVGGALGGLNPPVSWATLLPGYDQPDATSVDWLSESGDKVTLAPGESTTLTVTLDAASLTQPGTYTASVVLIGDTPYGTAPVPVSLTVNPPSTWGKLTGTVSSWNGTTTAPLSGATLQIEGDLGTWTVRTDSNGRYAQWLDEGNHTLQVVAARDGYQPLVLSSSVTAHTTTALDAVLAEVGAAKGASQTTVTAADTAYGTAPKAVVKVTGASSITPTGKVTVSEGTTVLGTVSLNADGNAGVALPATLSAGAHTLTVSYAGDSRLARSSATAVLTVTKAAATVSVQAPASVKHTKQASVTVTVTATGTVPGGTVTVTEGGRVVATGTLTDGKAVLTLPKLSKGTHTLTAGYAGSATVSASTGAAFKVTST